MKMARKSEGIWIVSRSLVLVKRYYELGVCRGRCMYFSETRTNLLKARQSI